MEDLVKTFDRLVIKYFVMLGVAVVFASLVLIAFTVITDPGSVGRFFGEIVAGFNSTVK